MRPLHPVATGPLLVVAAALGALLVSTSARYGPHRDELYFVSAGARPAWGYPDQPPLTPMLAGLADALAPGSLVALRASSVVAVMGVVLVAGLSARELGGRVAAQALAAVTTGSGVLVLVLGHLLSTSTPDLLVWSLVAWLALRALLRDDPRWWLAAGAVAGAGLLNKHLVAFLLLGLGVGVLLTGAVRRHLRSPWLWAGLVTVAVLWAPTLAWQAAAGWPQLELAADIREEYAVVGERVASWRSPSFS